MPSCIEFRRDSFQINYGAEKSFDSEMGADGDDYASGLLDFQEQYPYGEFMFGEKARLLAR